ncbi:potassium-transporting ATPase subunit KdpA [Rheinheimera sp. MM224]|uniref:potassium-transporting ATPase subunit KdpA n=1 Tax=Rheinheimera sp. MM224 TaxID=3019969 RepID=UPI0021F850D1|nr:potassium-transporting ATPase subunit KdpA [Rheinheimera sp. MM224]CAI3806624.1 Potassium-transporting ATPase potassium-binding subunit [Rheinheimera sp. MM224]
MEIMLILTLALLLAWPLGAYMTGIFSGQKHWSDKVFGPVENGIFKILGVKASEGMNWKSYGIAFLISNLVLGVIAFLLLMFQHVLPMNPDGIGPLSWDLALHTAVSFLTNTNQQHYSGQAQLSYLSQGFVIVTLQFVTPAMGLAVCLAVLRGLIGGRQLSEEHKDADEGEERDLGNYYQDTVRAVLRLMLPLAALVALLLASQGVPSTYQASPTVPVVEQGQSLTEQKIPLGPVAAMVAIKQLGTNGGGWYGPNSANPLENPTPVANAIETIALVLIPIAIVFMAGGLLRQRGFARMSLAVMGFLSLFCVGAAIYSEQQPNAAFSGLAEQAGNMEGKEVRLGTDLSALWATLTTQTSNGSVNAMHDSLNPVAGLVTRSGMLINAIWGGIGCGFVNFIVYVWIAVFIAGLMIGRTPEIFGRKLEKTEISWLGVLLVLPSAVILTFTAITVAIPAITGNSNPGLHGIAQVFYEYTSAFANNGSGFEGLGDNTPWWNISCVIVLLLGRYLPLVIPLVIAGLLAKKRQIPVSNGTLPLHNLTFGVTLVTVILILNFLSFLPSMVLGPIGEALELTSIAGDLK